MAVGGCRAGVGEESGEVCEAAERSRREGVTGLGNLQPHSRQFFRCPEQALDRHAIEQSQVLVQEHAFTTNDENSARDVDVWLKAALASGTKLTTIHAKANSQIWCEEAEIFRRSAPRFKVANCDLKDRPPSGGACSPNRDDLVLLGENSRWFSGSRPRSSQAAESSRRSSSRSPPSSCHSEILCEGAETRSYPRRIRRDKNSAQHLAGFFSSRARESATASCSFVCITSFGGSAVRYSAT